jgi:hypothetical protein
MKCKVVARLPNSFVAIVATGFLQASEAQELEPARIRVSELGPQVRAPLDLTETQTR